MINPYITILMDRYRQKNERANQQNKKNDKHKLCLDRCTLMGGHSFWDKERLYECIDNCKKTYSQKQRHKTLSEVKIVIEV